MPDLTHLLSEAAEQRRPAHQPDFDSLRTRHRRRSQRRRVAAVSATLLVVLAGVLLQPWNRTARPPVQPGRELSDVLLKVDYQLGYLTPLGITGTETLAECQRTPGAYTGTTEGGPGRGAVVLMSFYGDAEQADRFERCLRSVPGADLASRVDRTAVAALFRATVTTADYPRSTGQPRTTSPTDARINACVTAQGAVRDGTGANGRSTILFAGEATTAQVLRRCLQTVPGVTVAIADDRSYESTHAAYACITPEGTLIGAAAGTSCQTLPARAGLDEKGRVLVTWYVDGCGGDGVPVMRETADVVDVAVVALTQARSPSACSATGPRRYFSRLLTLDEPLGKRLFLGGGDLSGGTSDVDPTLAVAVGGTAVDERESAVPKPAPTGPLVVLLRRSDGAGTQVTVSADGTFTAQLPPGRYTASLFRGSSGQPCAPDTQLEVSARSANRLDLRCPGPQR